jgi:TonB family protein
MFQQRWSSKRTRLTHAATRINNHGVMRTLQCMFLIAAIGIPSAGQKVGYVYCSSRDNLLPTVVYSSPPMSLPVATLNCGDKVQVLGRRESWVRIAPGRYVVMTTISQRKDRYVALNLPLPPEPPVIDRRTGTLMPRIISNPNPEYTEAALKAGVHGSVIIKLTVGKDGNVRDLKVLNGLGYGLDESAIKAVQSWKFKPALRDGIPVDCAVAVELDFPPKNP